MNNMKYYNDSLAYDFEMFMPRTAEKPRDNIVKMPVKKPEERKIQRRALKAVSVSAFSVMAAYCKGNSSIDGCEAINKSYPLFFNDYISLGGECNVIGNRK